MALSTAKTVEVLFENAKETYEHQTQMLDLVDVFAPNSADMQNASNVIWRPKQQHAPVKEGWDMSGQFGSVIEEYWPATLGTPKNDAFQLRADDLRDSGFWERRGKQSGLQQATELNKGLANLVVEQGSLFYRSNAANGYDFVGEAQTLLNERQVYSPMRAFTLNERDRQFYASDLAQRGTLSGRPEDSYRTGQIGKEVAQFDIYSGSYIPNLIGGASPDTTVVGDQSFKPEGQVTQGAVEINVDYRLASLPVVSSAGYNVGDKISFAGVTALGLADKTDSGSVFTATVVNIPDGTTLEIFPKPIALDDPSLSAEEAASANINTQILGGAVVTRLNTDASARSNIFWAKDSIEVIGGDAPISLLSQYGGMKVISTTLKSGQSMYMAYDGNIDDLTFKCRLFTWYGLNMCNPMAAGVGVRF